MDIDQHWETFVIVSQADEWYAKYRSMDTRQTVGMTGSLLTHELQVNLEVGCLVTNQTWLRRFCWKDTGTEAVSR